MPRTALALSTCFAAALAAFLSGGSVAVAKGPRVGDMAPPVALRGVDGKQYRPGKQAGVEVTVIVFTCRTCPVSSGYIRRINELARKYRDRKVQVLAVNASDGLADSKRHAKRYSFPYTHDASGKGAKAFGARMTPEAFVLNGEGRIVYRGAVDNSQRRPTKHYVRDAVESTLKGRPIKVTSTDPFGCSLRLLSIKMAASGE